MCGRRLESTSGPMPFLALVQRYPKLLPPFWHVDNAAVCCPRASDGRSGPAHFYRYNPLESRWYLSTRPAISMPFPRHHGTIPFTRSCTSAKPTEQMPNVIHCAGWCPILAPPDLLLSRGPTTKPVPSCRCVAWPSPLFELSMASCAEIALQDWCGAFKGVALHQDLHKATSHLRKSDCPQRQGLQARCTHQPAPPNHWSRRKQRAPQGQVSLVCGAASPRNPHI